MARSCHGDPQDDLLRRLRGGSGGASSDALHGYGSQEDHRGCGRFLWEFTELRWMFFGGESLREKVDIANWKDPPYLMGKRVNSLFRLGKFQ